MTTESERIVARLPVIRTCGDCSHNVMRYFSGDTGRVCLHDEDRPRRVEMDSEPPAWCPLRAAALPAEAGDLEAWAQKFTLTLFSNALPGTWLDAVAVDAAAAKALACVGLPPRPSPPVAAPDDAVLMRKGRK